MNYPGGKNGAGTYQRIINQIPPHEHYIEPFLGSGAIMRLKRPAPHCSIGIDMDHQALAAFPQADYPFVELMQTDGVIYLADQAPYLHPETFIYLDPPYLLDTRRAQRQLYRCELYSEDEHRMLLTAIKRLRCMVAISGYWSSLYESMLANWRVISWQQITRGGDMATEYLWMNYPEPVELHDYRYLGDDYRERERIKRKKARWLARLGKMPASERYALLASIAEYSDVTRAAPAISGDAAARSTSTP